MFLLFFGFGVVGVFFLVKICTHLCTCFNAETNSYGFWQVNNTIKTMILITSNSNLKILAKITLTKTAPLVLYISRYRALKYNCNELLVLTVQPILKMNYSVSISTKKLWCNITVEYCNKRTASCTLEWLLVDFFLSRRHNVFVIVCIRYCHTPTALASGFTL